MAHNSTQTTNPALFPSLKRAPDSRMIGKVYAYVPGMITKIEEIPSGSHIILRGTPKDKDVLCQVEYNLGTYFVFWKDLVKL